MDHKLSRKQAQGWLTDTHTDRRRQQYPKAKTQVKRVLFKRVLFHLTKPGTTPKNHIDSLVQDCSVFIGLQRCYSDALSHPYRNLHSQLWFFALVWLSSGFWQWTCLRLKQNEFYLLIFCAGLIAHFQSISQELSTLFTLSFSCLLQGAADHVMFSLSFVATMMFQM